MLDVAELTGRPIWAIQSALEIRSFVAEPGRWQSFPVFMFVHENLREHVADMVSVERLHILRRQLHNWADAYRSLGWLENTPDYLLLWYPRMLEKCDDFERMVDCVTDLARHDRMRERSGSDDAAIAEVDLALATIAPSGDRALIERLSVRRADLG